MEYNPFLHELENYLLLGLSLVVLIAWLATGLVDRSSPSASLEGWPRFIMYFALTIWGICGVILLIWAILRYGVNGE